MTGLRGAFARGTLSRRAVEGMLIGLLGGAGAVALSESRVLEEYELRSVDARMRRFADPAAVTDEIVVLEVDEETVRLKELDGVFLPFPRDVWRQAVILLSTMNPKAIVFDFTFKDSRESAHLAGLDVSDDPSGNFAFGEAAWSVGNVVFGVDTTELGTTAAEDAVRSATRGDPAVTPYFLDRLGRVEVRGPIAARAAPGAQRVAHLVQPEKLILLGSRAVGLVDTNHIEDADDVLRRFAPVSRVSPQPAVDLAVLALSVAAAGPPEPTPYYLDGRFEPPGARGALPPVIVESGVARVGSHEIPLREDGTAWIHWRGDWTRDPRLRARTRSAVGVLASETFRRLEDGEEIPTSVLDPKDFEGKIVIVGFTMQGEASDLVSTPFGRQPGVFKYASTLDTILTGAHLRSVPRSLDRAVQLGIGALTGLIVLVLAESARKSRRRPAITAGIALAPGFVIALVVFIGAYASYGAGWIVSLFATEVGIAATTFICAGMTFTLAQRDMQEEARKKEEYLSLARQGMGRAAVDELIRQGKSVPDMGGQRFQVTLFFSDIAGFTTISEKLEAIQLIDMLNEYLRRVTALLVQHHAQIDKYIGDAVMCFWNAPYPLPDAPVWACRAALGASKLIEEYSKELVARGLSPLKTRIGLNTGSAVVGWIGLPGERFYYTALGDTVNLASRLEGANKAYGTTIMLGPETYEEAKHAIVARELDLVRVKGKKIPVRVYELLGLAEEALPREREIKRRYEAALALFRERKFAQAAAEFEALVREFDDSPSKTYLENCRERMETPPEADWDGSNELTEK